MGTRVMEKQEAGKHAADGSSTFSLFLGEAREAGEAGGAGPVVDFAIPELPPRQRGYDHLRVDIVGVASKLFGPPRGREGEPGSWWFCPFHPDSNPSLFVDEKKCLYHCRGCGTGGDAADLIMKAKGWKFQTAIRRLQEWKLLSTSPSYPTATCPAGTPTRPPDHPAETSNGRRSGGDGPNVVRRPWPKSLLPKLVEPFAESCRRYLWTVSTSSDYVMAYLRWRGLRSDTIERAGLGFLESVRRPEYWPLKSSIGLTIPWRQDRKIQFMMFRRLESLIRTRRVADGEGPRYFEVYRAAPTVYPGLEAIEVDLPLVVVEGELDALLLGQELQGLAGVITLGLAAKGPTPEILEASQKASRIYLAFDSDGAGDAAAARWPGPSERIRPPAKDWTDAHQRKCICAAFGRRSSTSCVPSANSSRWQRVQIC